jgi:hypothetical protein
LWTSPEEGGEDDAAGVQNAEEGGSRAVECPKDPERFEEWLALIVATAHEVHLFFEPVEERDSFLGRRVLTRRPLKAGGRRVELMLSFAPPLSSGALATSEGGLSC